MCFHFVYICLDYVPSQRTPMHDVAKSRWVDARFKEGIAIRTAGGADHEVPTVDCGQFNPVSWLYTSTIFYMVC